MRSGRNMQSGPEEVGSVGIGSPHAISACSSPLSVTASALIALATPASAATPSSSPLPRSTITNASTPRGTSSRSSPVTSACNMVVRACDGIGDEAPSSSPTSTRTTPPARDTVGISSGSIWNDASSIISSCSGSLTKIWSPSTITPDCSGISSWIMPEPASVQWIAPGAILI